MDGQLILLNHISLQNILVICSCNALLSGNWLNPWYVNCLLNQHLLSITVVTGLNGWTIDIA